MLSVVAQGSRCQDCHLRIVEEAEEDGDEQHALAVRDGQAERIAGRFWVLDLHREDDIRELIIININLFAFFITKHTHCKGRQG